MTLEDKFNDESEEKNAKLRTLIDQSNRLLSELSQATSAMAQSMTAFLKDETVSEEVRDLGAYSPIMRTIIYSPKVLKTFQDFNSTRSHEGTHALQDKILKSRSIVLDDSCEIALLPSEKYRMRMMLELDAYVKQALIKALYFNANPDDFNRESKHYNEIMVLLQHMDQEGDATKGIRAFAKHAITPNLLSLNAPGILQSLTASYAHQSKAARFARLDDSDFRSIGYSWGLNIFEGEGLQDLAAQSVFETPDVAELNQRMIDDLKIDPSNLRSHAEETQNLQDQRLNEKRHEQ